MARNDMRFPILYALAYPERLSNPFGELSLAGARFEFSEVEPERYPAIGLARDALAEGGAAPAVLNAANEIAVEAFLSGKIRFPSIVRIVAETRTAFGRRGAPDSVAEAEEIDRQGPRDGPGARSPVFRSSRVSFLEDVLAMAVVLSIVVFIHEFGHFATAKLAKFPVEVFSFGFGKRLFGVKWRGTDYRVSALPLGGYVRVLGLGPDESTAVGAAEASAAVSGPRWKRAAILLAGPAMNFVLAIALGAGVFMVGRKVPAYRLQPAVVQSIAPNSAGQAAGFRKGDRIVAIDGKAVENWQDAEFAFAISPRQKLSVAVDRAGSSLTIPLVPRGVSKFDIGYTGIGPALHPRVGRVLSRSPAEAAGFQSGDVILSVSGETVESVPEVLEAVGRHSPGPETFVVTRKGQTLPLTVSPRKESDGWKIGVSLNVDVPEVLEKFPPVEAVRQGWRSLRTDTQATLGVIVKLFAGRASVKQMSGPIAIGQFAGEAAREGFIPLVSLMGMLSLQLGILNLLPVPMLDGGQLAVLLVEGAIRRDFSLRVKERILQFGFVLLVLLMGVVIYNDILKVF